jgi:hypothetical protein
LRPDILHVVREVWKIVALIAAGPALSGPAADSTYNSYGYPGLIDMPGAHSRPDGELGLSVSHFKNTTRTTLTFQMTPRMSGSFRYSNLYDLVDANATGFVFDHSFSIHYRFADETARRPALAIGLNDFLGTGVYSSEYLVASKTLNRNIRVTGGIGWGRLAGVGGFTNPLAIFGDSWKTRPGRTGAQGGTFQFQKLFHGDAAFFGGIQWQTTEKLLLTAEYSSDVYPREDGFAFTRKIPFNFGATYKIRPHARLSVNYLYGSELGVQLSIALNPKSPPSFGGRDKAPPPVVVRSPRSAAQLGWDITSESKENLRNQIITALQNLDLELHGLSIDNTTVQVEFEGSTNSTSAQSVGRVSRVLTGILPASVEQFVIVPVVNGIAVSQITIRRSDLEQLEYAFDGSWGIFAQSKFSRVAERIPPTDLRYPRFEANLRPYLSTAWFDPDQPLRADFGIEARAQFEPAKGILLVGAVRKKIIGNLDQSTRISDSVLPHVRSDSNIYDREGDPALTQLTAAYYFQSGPNVFGRVTTGYLEPMFGGFSGELLWKPNDSRFALGAELNYVRQRDFDQRFGFQDYKITTGHVSGYWQFADGLHLQVDAGRYLAGDYGATFTLDREFRNGWRIGAFATKTNVSASDFGEGSFDKGIRITIPIAWISGAPNREVYETTIRPVTRDGGAKLDVPGRLYSSIRGFQKTGLRNSWGRFWR